MIHITDYVDQAQLHIILATTSPDNWNAREMTLKFIEHDPNSERYQQASSALLFYMIEITST